MFGRRISSSRQRQKAIMSCHRHLKTIKVSEWPRQPHVNNKQSKESTLSLSSTLAIFLLWGWGADLGRLCVRASSRITCMSKIQNDSKHNNTRMQIQKPQSRGFSSLVPALSMAWTRLRRSWKQPRTTRWWPSFRPMASHSCQGPRLHKDSQDWHSTFGNFANHLKGY